MRFVAVVLFISVLAEPTANAKWEHVSGAPQFTRAIVVDQGWSFVGFAASRATQSVFSGRAGVTPTYSSPLGSAPEFYGHARDGIGSRMCIAIVNAGNRSLACYGTNGREIARSTLPVAMTSGALVGNVLWVVDPSGSTAPRRSALVELHRTARGWAERRRVISPLCSPRDNDHECSELEVHALESAASLGVIPLLGRFDRTVFRYPSIGIWNTATGTIKLIDMPTVEVPEGLRPLYGRAAGGPLRLIYRSAASRAGKVAVIPVLPSDEKDGVRHDQLWLYDGKRTWQRIAAQEAINAVAFVGEQPVIVTRSGDILRWVP
jgi:hypothetical protein